MRRAANGGRRGWLAGVLLLLAACGDRPVASSTLRDGDKEGGSAEASGAFLGRDEILGSFLSQHWELPVPLQGPTPPGFTEAESSLSPEVCGACHPIQYFAWQTSFHAAAFSPGFAGQLIEGELATPRSIRDCQVCHAPLEEQQPFTTEGTLQPAYDPALRQHGIVCASCHVRAHQVYGPPRREGIPPLPPAVPHGGFTERTEYLESRFCATCHQFFDDPGVNGKPIENMFVEWQASPQAKEGRSCQDCHMPDRAHLWRGIHDPETVRTAVDVELVVESPDDSIIRGALRVRNRDVGHAFPSYVTPRVFLRLFQVDSEGMQIAGTRLEATIGREIDFSTVPWTEVFDTRLFPGETAQLLYDLPRAPEAEALVGRVIVDPDFHYRGVFASLIDALNDRQALGMIAEAGRRASESRYVLAEIRRPFNAGARGWPPDSS
jgi:hypothetical protein